MNVPLVLSVFFLPALRYINVRLHFAII